MVRTILLILKLAPNEFPASIAVTVEPAALFFLGARD